MKQVFQNDVAYDDTEFEVCKDEANKDYLHYIGQQTDLSKFEIPHHGADGRPLSSIRYMFMGTNVQVPPPIPYGVTDVDYAFAVCPDLVAGADMPDSVVTAKGTYDSCVSLESAPNISKNAAMIDGFAADCPNIMGMAHIPPSVKSANSAFQGCENLEGFTGGESIQQAYAMTAGCKNMIMPSPNLNPEGMYTDIFAGCDRYNAMVKDAGLENEGVIKQVQHDYSKSVEADLAGEGIYVPEAETAEVAALDSAEA